MIGLLGFGTVGQGVWEILGKNQFPYAVKKILIRNLKKERPGMEDKKIFTDNPEEILEDKEIRIILECTGDDRAYDWIKKAFESGKDVVTANKKVVSEHFEELSALAEEKGCAFLYEASVAAGTFLLKPLKEEKKWSEISQVEGILNGTSNFILTKMQNKSYEEALKEAQDSGYAEEDPSADVKGLDAMRKLRIFSTLAFGGKVGEEDIFTLGIQNLEKKDLDFLKEQGYGVKLLAKGVKRGDEVTAYVVPTAIPLCRAVARIDGTRNLGSFTSTNGGRYVFEGLGAGKLPTADAMLRDTADILERRCSKKNPLGQEKLSLKQARGQVYFRFHDREEEAWKTLAKCPWGEGYISIPVDLEKFSDFPGTVILLEDEHAL